MSARITCPKCHQTLPAPEATCRACDGPARAFVEGSAGDEWVRLRHVEPHLAARHAATLSLAVVVAYNALGLVLLALNQAPPVMVPGLPSAGTMPSFVIGLVLALLVVTPVPYLLNLVGRYAGGLPVLLHGARGMLTGRSVVAEVAAWPVLQAALATTGLVTALCVVALTVWLVLTPRPATVTGALLLLWPLRLCVVAGVMGLLAAWLYGRLARCWGGVDLTTVPATQAVSGPRAELRAGQGLVLVRVRGIGACHAGLLVAGQFVLIALPFALTAVAGMPRFMGGQPDAATEEWSTAVAILIVYPIAGFLLGALGSLAYGLVAHITGGLLVETTDLVSGGQR